MSMAWRRYIYWDSSSTGILLLHTVDTYREVWPDRKKKHSWNPLELDPAWQAGYGACRDYRAYLVQYYRITPTQLAAINRQGDREKWPQMTRQEYFHSQPRARVPW